MSFYNSVTLHRSFALTMELKEENPSQPATTSFSNEDVWKALDYFKRQNDRMTEFIDATTKIRQAHDEMTAVKARRAPLSEQQRKKMQNLANETMQRAMRTAEIESEMRNDGGAEFAMAVWTALSPAGRSGGAAKK